MRRFFVSLASIGTLLALTATPALADKKGKGAGKKGKTIVETVVKISGPSGFDTNPADFDILREAAIATGLDRKLDGRRQLTVFAPTDQAFLDLTGAATEAGGLQLGGSPRPASGEAGAQVPRRTRPPSREAGRELEADPDAAEGLVPHQGPRVGRADRRDRSEDHDRRAERRQGLERDHPRHRRRPAPLRAVAPNEQTQARLPSAREDRRGPGLAPGRFTRSGLPTAPKETERVPRGPVRSLLLRAVRRCRLTRSNAGSRSPCLSRAW